MIVVLLLLNHPPTWERHSIVALQPPRTCLFQEPIQLKILNHEDNSLCLRFIIFRRNYYSIMTNKNVPSTQHSYLSLATCCPQFTSQHSYITGFIMLRFLLFSFLLLFVSSDDEVVDVVEEDDGVLALDEESFKDALKTYPLLMIEFYAPWQDSYIKS